ncbi:hypothetical protein YPPY03_2934, partial [Yersinia pestis PY-03]
MIVITTVLVLVLAGK